MKLYYAVGGGLGHLSRAIAFIHSHPLLSPENTVVMVAEREMYTLQKTSFASKEWAAMPTAMIPTALFEETGRLSEWLQSWLRQHQPNDVFLDTFPAGIAGEWNHIPVSSCRFHYTGRYLNWPAYRFSAKLMFETAYRVEEWHSGQETFLQQHARECADLDLSYPPAALNTNVREQVCNYRQGSNEVWAIIHSEPAEEVEALLSYARDMAVQEAKSPRFLLCSSLPFPEEEDVLPLQLFPAYGLFPHVDRIITACGFNLIQQAAPFRNKHICMPFPRRYDDQFARFKKWKAKNLLPLP
ncbi:MAG: hypothetical protein ACLFQO_15170 [Cyclobacteriaceae bacterium]